MNDDIFINQSKYIKDLFKEFGTKNVKFGVTSISITLKLDNDLDRKLVDVKGYKGMIGLLSYRIASKPDIIFSACSCARFQAKS